MQNPPKADEGEQEAKATDTSITKPTASPPQKPPTGIDARDTPEDQPPPQPILVQLVGGDDLKPFEQQTITIAGEAMGITRRTYWIAFFGFLAALAAAIFVGTQVKEMSYQTQIMASQSESAAAGAALGERNTREQLRTAQKQAKAAQDSVEAIRGQMRQDQRPWLKLDGGIIKFKIEKGQQVTGNISSQDIGKTAAKDVVGNIVIRKIKEGDRIKFAYKGLMIRSSVGVVYPGDAPSDNPVVWFDPTKGPIPQPRILDDQDVKELKEGKVFFVLYAIFRYTDGFNKRHWTKFCAFTTVASNYYHAKQCTSYNSVDSNF